MKIMDSRPELQSLKIWEMVKVAKNQAVKRFAYMSVKTFLNFCLNFSSTFQKFPILLVFFKKRLAFQFLNICN